MRGDADATAKRIAPIGDYRASQRAMCRGTRQSAGRCSFPRAQPLLLVAVLVLVIAIAPGGRAIAGTLEIPQAAPSLPSTQATEPPSTASPHNSSGEIASGSAADYAAQSAPTSTAQAPPMPQVAGIDQYMNQGGRASGYPPGGAPDPRNNRANPTGGLLMGGLMGGLIALDIAVNHHHR